MPQLGSATRHTDCPWPARLAALLTGVSAAALLAASAPDAAAEPRGLWNPAQAAAAAAAAAANGGAEQGSIAAAQAQRSLEAAASAIRGMWNAQAAARAAAPLSSNIFNGLGKGASGQLPGLVVDPRVPKDLANPKPGENPYLWLNATLPSQTKSGGQTNVTIHQTAPQAVMTWEYFNIGPSTTLIFDQQGHASWVALNRIDATGVPSQIQGRIKADGTVLLINPNGIIFGGTSQISLGSLIASALDIDTNAAASVFERDQSAYKRITLSDGVKIAAPPKEESANKAFVEGGLFPATNAEKTRGAVLFSLSDQSLKGAGGKITVERGASITTHESASGDGGYVALLGTSVTNGGGISTPGGQTILAAANRVQMTYPAPTTTGTARKLSVSTIVDLNAAQVDPQNTAPPSLSSAGTVTNLANGILAANNGNVTLVGDRINQFGGIAVTTSVTRPGSVTLDTSNASPEASGDIILGRGSLIAILPDAKSGTIPSATATADYFASTLQPRIDIAAKGNIDMQPDARIKAPAAKMTMAAGLQGTGTVLLQSGSSIDLSGLKGVTLPMSINEVRILLTAAELANSPLAKNLIGTTVTIDARLSGVRADGIKWVGSPLLDANGYTGLIPKTIEELLTRGGSFSASAPQNFIQQAGSVIDISGGFVSYEGGTIKTTQLLGADGRIYDIGNADPRIAYTGVAGQFIVNHPQWGIKDIFVDVLRTQGRYEPGYIAGASAGSVTVQAATPILGGTISGDIVTGVRQRTLAQGGGTAAQLTLDQLPSAAALSIIFTEGTAPYNIVLKPGKDAGPDPFGLATFSLETASTWAPALADNLFPIFTDSLSAAGFGSISITGTARGALQNTLSMTADATLTVRPGGSVTLGGVTEINGTINARGGSITLTGINYSAQNDQSAPPVADLVIGPTAVLNVSGLWVNDTGASGTALLGSAFIDGGSITINTPAGSRLTMTRIKSGTLADGTSLAGKILLSAEDVTQSIVLAPGSIIDVSSGGYVDANGRLKIASSGLPAGKGGSLSLQTYTLSPGQERLSKFRSSGTVGDVPIELADGTTVLPGTAIYFYGAREQPFGDPPEYPSYIIPADGRSRANVIMGGMVYAAGFDGGGTFSLRAPAIKISPGGGPVTSYFSPESLASIAAQTGLPAAAFITPGASNIGTSAAQAAVSAVKGGEIALPSAFFTGNAFGAYVLSSAVGDVTVEPNTTISLRQANLLPGGTPGRNLDVDQPTGAIPRLFAAFGYAADGLRKPVDLTLYDPDGPSGILLDKGAAILADSRASAPSSISLVTANAPVTILGKIIAPSGAINLFNAGADVDPYASPVMAQDVWIGKDAVLDVSSMFVPNPRITTYSTGSLLDAGTISLGGETVVVEEGAQLLLEGRSRTVQIQDFSVWAGLRFIDIPVWSNGGSLQIAGSKLYFAGTVSAKGGAPLASGGSLTIGNIAVPEAVASYVIGAVDASGNTLKGNLPGPQTVILEPEGNIAASLAAARQASGSDAPYPITPEELAALLPAEAGGYIGADTLSKSGFESVSIYAETVAFNGSLHVSLPGALTLVASSGSFVLLPESRTLLPEGVTYKGGLWKVDPKFYTTPGENGIPSIGRTAVTLEAGYVRLVGGGGVDSDAGGQLVPPKAADGTLNVVAKWIDLQRVIGLNNVLNANFTSSSAIRLLPDIYGYGSTTAANSARKDFAGALVTAGNLTLSAAVIYPASGTQFLLMSTGKIAGVNDTLTIRQTGNASAPWSAGGGLVLDAVNIVQAGTLWAPLGTITLGLTDPNLSQLPQAIKDVLPNAGGLFVATGNVTLEEGSLTSVSAAGLSIPYGYTFDGANWSVGTLFTGNPLITPPAAVVLGAPPAKAVSSFGANITAKSGAVIDVRGGGDIYATEFISGTGGTRNVLVEGPAGQTVYALVPASSALAAAYDATFAALYGSDSSGIRPGMAISIAGGNGIPAGTYVLLPGMYATLPGAYRVVQVSGSANPTGPASVAMPDGSLFVRGTYANALTGARSSQAYLFELQPQAVWTQYSKIDITAGTSYFRSLALSAAKTVPPLPIDGGLLALGATSSLTLNSTNKFSAGTSPFAPGMTGLGGEASISAANILILAAGKHKPPQTGSAETPYLVLDADQISNLGATRVVIGGTSLLDKPGTIVAAAENVEVATDAKHPLSGTEIILVTKGSEDGKGITVDAGSVIRAEGTVPAGAVRDIRLGSVSDGVSGDGSLLRIANGAPVQVIRENVPELPTGRITIGTAPGTAILPTVPGAAVTIEGVSLTLDSSGSTVVASNTLLKAQNYDLAADVINIGGGRTGLVLSQGMIASLAGAETVRLRSATVFNFFDRQGLAVGDKDKPVGTLTFDGAGFFSEGGSTLINARNVVLTNTQVKPDTHGGLNGSGGTLKINASGTLTQASGSFVLEGFSEAAFNAGKSIGFSGTGKLDAGAAHVALTAPALVVNAGAEQALVTAGLLEILKGDGQAPVNEAANIGGALTLTGASILDKGRIEALSGNVTLTATKGDVTLARGAEIIATGSQFAVQSQSVAAPGGSVKLAAARDVMIASGARVDVSAAANGYAGTLSVKTGETGAATLDGTLLGGASHDALGGRFLLDAGRLFGAMPISGGFTGAFAVTLKQGDIEIKAGTALISNQVLLAANQGSVIVGGTIDAKGPRAGTISLYGAEAVTIENGAQLIARYDANAAGSLGLASGAAGLVQTGGKITLGTTGKADGTFNADYGYQNVKSSGMITVASGAILDVSGGPGGNGIVNTGGEVILRAPLLADGRVNVAFHGTLVTNAGADGKPSGKGVSLNAYAVWSTADATTGAHHFDGIIDAAGWFDANGKKVEGTDFESIFTPTGPLNAGHIGFYQKTLVDFVQKFAVKADFSGAQIKAGGAPAQSLPDSMRHDRPEIALVNASSEINGGNITIASNWNLGAGTFDRAGNYVPYYRTASGDAGVLTLQAVNNIDVRATISDGFYETKDVFGGTVLVANFIANNPQASGPVKDFNTTTAASLMPIVQGINNGSFSYNFVAGAAFNAGGVAMVNPHAVAAVAADSGRGRFSIDGHTSYSNPLNSPDQIIIGPPPTDIIHVPSLVRTGTGSITIAAAGNVEILDEVAPGAIYTAGAAAEAPAGFTAPAMSPVYELFANGLVSTPAWAEGGGTVTITAGHSIAGIAPSVSDPFTGAFSGQDWNTWYYHSGSSNGSGTPFTGVASEPDATLCGAGSFSCQTAAWVNYATFKGIGALGGGNISLFAGADITNISASLPETLAVSGGMSANSPPVAHYYGGGNLEVRTEGNLNSGAFLVGRGAGLIVAGGAIQADASINPVTGAPNVPLLLAVQDGFITAMARGPVTLGAVYDPAMLPLSYDTFNAIGGATPVSVLPNGAAALKDGTITPTLSPWGAPFTAYGPASGIALSSTSGDITILGNGDTAFQTGGLQPAPWGQLLPASLALTAYSGNIFVDALNNDANLVPYPTLTGSSKGTISIIAAQSLQITNGTLSMPDLLTSSAQFVSNSPLPNLLNYVSPLGIPLGNLTVALHANDPLPAVIAAGADINGAIELIKPARIEAGHDITLGFVGQNNNPGDLTSIKAGNDIGGFIANTLFASYYYLYGPGAFLLEAGHNMGPFQLSIAKTTAGVAAVGDGSNVSGSILKISGTPLGFVPYLPQQSADITIRFGVGPGIDYAGAVSQFVDPLQAGSRGIDFLSIIAAILEKSREEAWAEFQTLPEDKQHLLVDRAFLDFLSQVAADYRNSSSPYLGQYSRAYDAIGTLFPASYGYTDNGTGGGNSAAEQVFTGQLNIAQSVLETQMGGDINIIGPGGGITVGTTSRDLLNPNQEGILTLGGGTIRAFTDGSILLNQSRVMTLQGGDINLFTANGDISAGEGPKTYVSNPPVSSICDMNGYCRVNPTGLVTGAGIGALVTLPGQDPSKSNVTLVAPHGTVDAGAAGVRVSGNLNIVAVQVLNSFNLQVQGSTTGLSVQASPNVGALTAASNVAGATQASVASSQTRSGASDTASVIIVEVIGYGGSNSGDEEQRRRAQ